MSFVGQLLGNSALSVDERIKNANQRLAAGGNAGADHWYDRINSTLTDYLKPTPNNPYTYDFWGDALAGPVSDSGPNGSWVVGIDKKPLSHVNDIVDKIESFASNITSGDRASGGSSYSSVRPIDNSGSTIDYMHADLAKHYGMDASAAYGEALQNTAYQRAVADLKAAGLNPVLAISGLHPAGSYVTGDTLRSGSGSGSSGGSSSGKSGKYVMSSNMYNAIGAAAQVVGAFVGFKYGTGPFKFMNAATVSQLSKNLVQAAIQGYGSLTEGR